VEKRVNSLPWNELVALQTIFAFSEECPKSSSSASKAKGHAAKGKSEKPETPPAEDSKK